MNTLVLACKYSDCCVNDQHRGVGITMYSCIVYSYLTSFHVLHAIIYFTYDFVNRVCSTSLLGLDFKCTSSSPCMYSFYWIKVEFVIIIKSIWIILRGTVWLVLCVGLLLFLTDSYIQLLLHVFFPRRSCM